MAADDQRTVELIFQPDGARCDVPVGTPIAVAAARAGIGIEQPCGGLGICGQCRIQIPVDAPEWGDDEARCFDTRELADGWRLACRRAAETSLTVVVPDRSRSRVQQILQAGVDRDVQVDPLVRAVRLTLPKPSLQDERGDWERVRAGLGELGVAIAPDPDPAVLARLPKVLRAGDWTVSAIVAGDRLLAVEADELPDGPYGVAVDVGTTTQVCYLIDLATGQDLAVAAGMNPQVRFGDDVIARIHHAGLGDGAAELRAACVEGLNAIIAEACEKADVPTARVYAVTIVGNTCMTHLLLGLPTRQLGEMPYVPVVQHHVELSGEAAGLAVAPTAAVRVLPVIGGFVGADTIGVLIAHLHDEAAAPRVAIDIGTNGEMVVQVGARRWAASAAAGPAFEGARIRDGMRGAPGAIAAVTIDEDVRCVTIEHQPARGLCGSGLLDAVAGMLRVGVLDFGGRLLTAEKAAGLPPALAARLIGEANGREFILVPAEQSATGEAIGLTQNDIRELQLAKGSICAALLTLLDHAGVSPSEVARVFLAGAFGSFLNIDSALRIGLLPPFERERIEAVGNAAAIGAKLALLSRRELALADDLAETIEHVTLSTSPQYQMHFMEQMIFPME